MNNKNLKCKLHNIIFNYSSPQGKVFNKYLILIIVTSVIVIIIDSVPYIKNIYKNELFLLEYLFTTLFSIEYILRIYCARKRFKYIFSFYGIIDLLAILPFYITILYPEIHSIISIQVFRLFRIARILKLTRHLNEFQVMTRAYHRSKFRISMFFLIIFIVSVASGAIMYVIEDEKEFTSIPIGIYWSIVTITTVGYGDIVPFTAIGKSISSFLMLLGYAIITIPTSIFTVELNDAMRLKQNKKKCPKCNHRGHDLNAYYCKTCGTELKHEKIIS